jgi:OFA family oxalate/formate antiporter-like MFS transporter
VAVSEERMAGLPNRWTFVIAAIAMQLCLGALYAFSVFRNSLRVYLGYVTADELAQSPAPATGTTEVSLAFAISIVFFAIAMIYAGRWQDRVGPRTVAMTGGVILGAGMILIRFLLPLSEGTQSPYILYLTYGVLGGLGVGFAYVTPIAVLVKWFPDMRGLITGIAVFGFGFGSFIFGPLGAQLIPSVGLLNTFLILGVIFLVIVVASGAYLRNPPAGYKPAGWSPPVPAAGAATRVEYSPGEMVGTPQFFLLWLIYLFGAAAGLMVIGQASPIGQEKAGLTPTEAAALAVGILAILNGLGRIFHGWVSDVLGRLTNPAAGRTWTLVLMFLEYIVVFMFILQQDTLSRGVFILGMGMVGLSYGGYLAIMPALTADFYGTKNVGINYGLVFTAWGAAGLLGTLLGSRIREITGSFDNAFVIFSVLSAVGIVLAFLTRKPRAVEVEAPRPA